MALVGLGNCFSKSVLNIIKPSVSTNVCSPKRIVTILASNISGKAYREDLPKPPPFPYKEKDFALWRRMFDSTTSRFDENSKLIVVEGPVASGKTAFAKELAEDLGMLHIPEPNMDIFYINNYGFDMRQLDSQLPLSCQSYDEKNFCMEPTHVNAAGFQMWMYRLRVSKYIDALAHILSTGQGVVTERCPYSDFVFVECMFKNKYLSRGARNFYYEMKRNTIDVLMRPHIVIYLDVPVKNVMEKIKKRNLPHEVKGKALNEKYLSDMDTVYKRDYLPYIEEHSDVLMYDWTTPGDVEAVVEDLERMDLDSYTKHDKKCRDWFKGNEQEWGDTRVQYADQKDELMNRFNIALFDVPELLVPGEDIEIYERVIDNCPGNEYEEGFNASQGDTNLLFKVKSPKYVAY